MEEGREWRREKSGGVGGGGRKWKREESGGGRRVEG